MCFNLIHSSYYRFENDFILLYSWVEVSTLLYSLIEVSTLIYSLNEVSTLLMG